MKCKVLLRVDSEHMSFQYLFGTVSLLSGNDIEIFLYICDWVKNLERLNKNKGRNKLTIQLFRLSMMLYMNIQSTTRLRTTVSPLGDVSDGFGNDGVVWYEFMS